MTIREAKTRLFEAVMDKDIVCSCSHKDGVIILRLNSAADRNRVAEEILNQQTKYQGHPVEILVPAGRNRRAKPK